MLTKCDLNTDDIEQAVLIIFFLDARSLHSVLFFTALSVTLLASLRTLIYGAFSFVFFFVLNELPTLRMTYNTNSEVILQSLLSYYGVTPELHSLSIVMHCPHHVVGFLS